MTTGAGRALADRAGRLAPSSNLALYLAAVVTVYLFRASLTAILVAVVVCASMIIWLFWSEVTIPAGRWRAALVFIGWVFVMRLALEVVAGVAPFDQKALLGAVHQAARVAVLIVGALFLVAVTPARAVVDELESSRIPRTVRLLVMMLIQYPRALRLRFDQIVEAQVARGADRPRSIPQRIAHGLRTLLPVMQSELAAIGERAGLIHLRGLDVDIMDGVAGPRAWRDLAALSIAIVAVVAAIAYRISGR